MAMLPTTSDQSGPMQFVNYAPTIAALDQSKYDPNNASGEANGNSVSSNYTPPAQANAVNIQKFSPAVAQQASVNQDTSSQSPYGITPSQAGSIGGKLVNSVLGKTGSGTFTNQINALDNFSANYLGTGAAAPTSLIAGTPGSGLGTASFVDAAGDSVAAGTPGAIATGANADIANSFAAAQSEVAASGTSAGTGLAGSLTSTSLSSILGSAGIGALGGGLLNKLIGGNETTGAIGGAIGAAAGAALMGTELGSAIGSFIPIPGLGTIAGGLLGGLIGGMFGNHSTPTNADNYGGYLTSSGGITGGGGGSKNPGKYTGYGQSGVNSFSDLATHASQSLGIQFNPKVDVDVGISTQHGGAFIYVGEPGKGQTIPFDNSSQQSTQDAYKKALEIAAQQSGYTDMSKIDSFYQDATNAKAGVFSPPKAPTIPVTSGSFSNFIANQNGNVNASNATPAISTAA